ncbi:MAG: amidohydrolase family protein [Flavobacteriales bacterium]|nr:amidohydrolase family protein [Flavobacteriales bacterium]
MRKITADFIHPISSEPIPNGVVIIDDNGKVQDVLSSAENLDDVEKHPGIICPGFVNTHCHLELSHMKGIVNESKGLVEFIKELMSQREADPDFVQQCIIDAETEMITNGIVAVGDISNGPDTFIQKTRGNLYYHTFIELYGFLDEQANESFENGLQLITNFKSQSSNYSLVPHSAYSASRPLWEKICTWNEENSGIISFHNEETEDENKLFIDGKGNFIDLMQWFGVDTSFWKPTGKSSLNSVKDILPPKVKTLLVHNTFTSAKELLTLNSERSTLYWCLCPNANWYIERRLPNINIFIETNVNVTLGTDSLSSNWGLSILSEMQRIKEHYPETSTSMLLKWGTHNGAELLGIENKYGSLKKGKSPGINLITGLKNGEITSASKVEKLV